MRIESSALTMQGGSSVVSMTSIQESLNVWTDQGSVNMSSSSYDVQEFSQKGIMVSTSVTSSVEATSSVKEDDLAMTEQELKIRLLEMFLSRIAGKHVKLRIPGIDFVSGGYDSSGKSTGAYKVITLSGRGQPSGSAGFGMIYSRTETQAEKSRVSFSAQGVVNTADGRQISLNLNFNIDQEVYSQSSFQLKAGDALKDPLVIDFGGGVASFTDRTMSFDIDSDGDRDTIQTLSAGSGYLALDQNNNGTIDDGSELFGPQTNNGYAELAQYDEDGNGWIDENDSVFNNLKIWYTDEKGNSQLAALSDKNVGAIYLGSVDTKMNMYSSSGIAGTLRQSGLVLLENGESRVMQELDVRI